jgi:hypothetical protein
MLTGLIVFVVIILFFAFFVVYKRDMVMRMFTLNAASPAGEFQQELEKAADAAISRLETQIAHLEFLLDEADARIAEFDRLLRAAPQGAAPMPAAAAEPGSAPPAQAVDVRLAPEGPAIAVSADEAAVRDGAAADRRKQILTMAEQGYSVTEIAKSTGAGKGEIMLLLQLNKK